MNNVFQTGLVWLRRDLRLDDHRALSLAAEKSKQVAVAFVFDTEILKHLDDQADLRLSFIHASLKELDDRLKTFGSQLIVCQGNPTEEIPKLVKSLKAQALFFNEDYEPYAKIRDQIVQTKLDAAGVPSFGCKDQVIFSGKEVLKSDGSPYQMFTPYKRAWLKKLRPTDYKTLAPAKHFYRADKHSQKHGIPELSKLGFKKTDFYYDFQKPGRKNALVQLKFFEEKIRSYQLQRDYPHLPGTSGLSVHLRFGTLSVRECVRLCLQSNSSGHQTWLSEIIWRDFYQMILDQYPYVQGHAFKSQYENINWKTSEKMFQAWCEGRTGFPLVDAGMRQLNATGWMHNRLRMITASFLTKDLLIDWRKGEAYFAKKLLDFDLAANNGGWQWSASTGCDAQPYFRIFNPLLQSKKFDPKGEFIRHWVPELKNCTQKDIHEPLDHKLYPKPVVDHQAQKIKALSLFKMI